MLKPNMERILSAPGVFSIYVFLSWLAIQVYRFIVPGEEAPLIYYVTNWRLLMGLVDFLELYPALALSGLVLPFAIKIVAAEDLKSFSPRFLKYIKSSVFTAIGAAVLYALVSLLVLPMARDYEASLRYNGRLYGLAMASAWRSAEEEDWEDVARFVRICERIWPDSQEFQRLATEADIRLQEALLTTIIDARDLAAQGGRRVTWPSLPDQIPLDVTEALAMAETAMSEERFFDAHWLATVAGRLAEDGSSETTAATRMASLAWNAINSLEPNAQETEQIRIFRLKREGYVALTNEDWIRAYYIFLELRYISPNDPDVENFLSISEQGSSNVAFFFDELEFALGNTITGKIFSLPYGLGRMVIRLSSLTIFSDSAYGTDMEILVFDRDARPAWRLSAPYVKMLPFTQGPQGSSAGGGSGSRVSLLCRVLDREDQNISWGPTVEGFGEEAPQGAQIAMDVGWEDFQVLADLYRGKDYYPTAELLAASRITGAYGYIPQVFQAEFLRRIANQLLFQVTALLSLVAGWRYRARKLSFFVVPMLVILPVVYHGVSYFSRSVVNNAVIWAIVTFGFNNALLYSGIAAFVLLIGSMIILAAQHE